MPNANRNAGDYFERSTRRALEAHGWVVVRAGGSLGPADLWAARAGNTLLMVACKTNGTIPPAERLAIVEAAAQAGARALVASRAKRGWVELRLVQVAPDAPVIDLLKVPSGPDPARTTPDPARRTEDGPPPS